MATQRQLAAILFTDIEGYTSRMQENEQAALELKDRHRKVMDREHHLHNGRIIQYYGDGSVSIFPSVVEAVQCALSMQLDFRKPPAVPVRMGLHLGDIIMQDGDVFGDGVNIAARIESLGVAGSVLLSDRVVDELSNHPEFRARSAGTYHFKNVQREVEVFGLSHEGLVMPDPNTLSGKTADRQGPPSLGPEAPIRSIAVLPFANMSNDPEQEYFSDGITEEILNALATVRDLKIAGRTSSFQFKGKNMDLRTIGTQLGVSTVLEGSVRKQGKKLRITAQLINVADGFHIWSERYDRDMDDIFAIQDEIALSITERLKLALQEHETKRLTRSYNPAPEAYDLYLKGRFFVNRRGAFIRQGLQFLQQAVGLDPDFALAHAGLADALMLMAFYGMVPPVSVMQGAKDAAETALRLDPLLSEPYCSLGFYYTCCAWNWAEGERCFRKAIEINPRFAQAHYWYGLLLLSWVRGDHARAAEEGRTAMHLEPLSAICHANYGAILHNSGKYGEALAVCEAGLELDPASFLCLIFKGSSLVSLNRFDEAIATFEFAMQISGRQILALHALIITYCWKGDLAAAEELMQELRDRTASEYVANVFMAIAAANLGRREEALTNLEQAYREKDAFLLSVRYAPWIPAAFRAEPAFREFLGRIGFPEPGAAAS